MKISVVCPFFNEEKIIVDSAQRMISNLNSQFEDWELILVNDGSKDNSLNYLLESKIIKKNNLRVLSCYRNQGRGWALKNGINASTGDIIVTTEVDCSWGDFIVRDLVNEITAKDLDVVVASPHMKKGGLKNVPLKRIFLTKVGNFLINSFFSSGVSMTTGMTRAYKKNVIKPLITFEKGKEFHLEVLLKLKILSFKIGEIPATITWPKKIKTKGKKNRRSSTNIKKTIVSHLRFLFSAQPSLIFSLLGTSGFIFGIIFISLAIYNATFGYTSIFGLILGIQFILFSLIFSGFTLIFEECRDISRNLWSISYQKKPPNLLEAKEIDKSEILKN